MSNPYIPTPAQFTSMQAMVEERLRRYDEVWVFVSSFDATELCGNEQECKCVGAHHVLGKLREILEIPS